MSQLLLSRYDSVHPEVRSSQLSTKGRSHLLLQYTSGELSAVGEASPLFGYGCDDLDAAQTQLERVTAAWVEHGLEALLQASGDTEGRHSAVLSLGQKIQTELGVVSKSARFAVEMLVLQLWSRRLGVPEWKAYTTSPHSSLPVSEVIDSSKDDALVQANEHVNRGVRALKVKCGMDGDREARLLRSLAENFGALVSLRADINGAWSSAEASAWLKDVASCELEWVEDPTADPSQWGCLRRLGTSLAVDEPLVHPEVDIAHAHVLVLKPMALGGASEILRLRKRARSKQKLSFSHLFDGPRALQATCALAFAFQSPGVVPGLSAHTGLLGHPAHDFHWLKADGLILPSTP